MAGIYIHIPFCRAKCIYCGFYSVAHSRQHTAYLEALQTEIRQRADYLHTQAIHTIYFGGGTPSLLAATEIRDILGLLRRHYAIADDAEITLEANPEQLSVAYCQDLRALGINRLSIGVQSFHDHVLRFMGRRHTSAEAVAAVEHAHAAGFDNLSIDLIYGVAERTDSQWAEEVRQATSLPIQHLSCYALTSEENSVLYKQIQREKLPPVDDEQAARQYQQLLSLLAPTPLAHYEVSNFATPGFESRHNSSYWNHTPYLGLGPAAHSFNGKSRQWNPANLKQYLTNIAHQITYEEIEHLSSNDLYNETLLLGLRTRRGIDLQEITKQFGTQRAMALTTYFEQCVQADFYEQKENRIRLTESGLWFADGIAGEAFIVE